MGRPENPITTPNRSLGRLAVWLRSCRSQAGLSYRQLAEGTVHSSVTLSRATTGEKIPKLPVVEAFTRACGADVAHARQLWREARWEEHRTSEVVRTLPPKLSVVKDPEDMIAALQHLYYRSGAMPIEEIERRAGTPGLLPHTTLHRMVLGETMLQIEQLVAFLNVCDVPEGERPAWLKAWTRAWRRRESEKEMRVPAHRAAPDDFPIYDPRRLEEALRPPLFEQLLEPVRSIGKEVSGLWRGKDRGEIEFEAAS
ncbi:helix-turn-helix domain-containing protein [Streptomyces fulvoviolaceus]|uniref:helix-turn-helix domain-containing protein n=1 Tax=Streptomyces fulvoviolaceus TaxID=285535 RepID=UPI00131E50B9|nr:helix-turn-helix transcriptional regulator [Streptomyces fulvoviolaceus]